MSVAFKITVIDSSSDEFLSCFFADSAPTSTPPTPQGVTDKTPPEPSPPVSSPTPAAPPSSSVGIVLDPYDILYTLTQSRIPNRQDYQGVAALTEEYLNTFFEGVLGLSNEIAYSSSSTVLTDNSFRLGEPVQVEYNTTIFFSESSTLVPGTEELHALLMSGFRGSQKDDYLATLGELSQTNLFSTTTDVEFVQESNPAVGRSSYGEGDTESSSKTQKVGVASAAAGGALVLLITGAMMYRRRSEGDSVGKGLDHDGHVTVAGDTYAASSLDSRSEVQSRPYEPTDWGSYNGAELSIGTHLRRTHSPATTLEELPESVSEEIEEYEGKY